ncbi:MAG: hypothetical protein ACI91G_001416 [Gammaproteobacteria bacterium]
MIASSDVVTFFVDEVLDVDVTSGDAELVGADGTDYVDQIVKFAVTKAGNGAEDFKVAVDRAVTGDDFDPTFSSVWNAGIHRRKKRWSNVPNPDADGSRH